jgi:hypothetical protein
MIPPALNLPLAEETEEPVARPPEPTPSTVTEIFSHPEAKLLARRHMMGHLGKIAAVVVLGLVMWGVRRTVLSNPTLLTSTDVATVATRPDPAPAPNTATAKPAPAPAAAPEGFLGKMRLALAKRATVDMTDNFKAGMEAWGSAPKTFAKGWSRDPAGYVRLGDLELFRPSLKFTDYRLEFFGQIENKGLGWVMRGQDRQNYYAMKFQVLQAGLRPVVSLVHYPVVDGKKGHAVSTPLDVMFHHNEPFHVTVDVSGNRFTASVEGQRIESWTDDSPAAGAAGFFADAGEKARLYWMRVVKNDDWLGGLCSYLAGSAKETAELWGPGIPTEPSGPGTPPSPPDMLLASTETGMDESNSQFFSSRNGAKTLLYRRNRWNL